MKLNLGAGDTPLPGYINLDRKTGDEIFPLMPSIMRRGGSDKGYDEIRASHVLEHFPHGQIDMILADWVKQLAPGGVLKIAVPDFEKVAAGYLDGRNQPTEGYVMGGQVDDDDYHKAIFDTERLKAALSRAGLVLIRAWTSGIADCAALPISLNLQGTKPHLRELSVAAVMSLPRVTWTANMIACFEALQPLKIRPRCYTGAYWDQCLERSIDDELREERPDAILTIDYDSVFTAKDVALLMQLMMAYPEADAIAPIQAARGADRPMLWMKGESNGDGTVTLPGEVFAGDLSPTLTAHFGLTLLRASKLKALKKPWFRSIPAPDGSWGEGHRDADVAFWDAWRETGNTLFTANRVNIGHLDLTVRFVSQDMGVVEQSYPDWRRNGKPKEAWT